MTSTGHITHLASALELAGQGLAVLPLHPVQGDVCSCSTGAECTSPGKHPIQSGWERVATSEGSTVAVEWGKNPGRGIGIHLGKSGLVVLDIDPRNDGIASLSRLEQLLGLSFDKVGQVIADTGGGGQHYYFRQDPQQVDQLAALTRHLARNYPGIDLLHGRHFCVAAPSMHKSGKAYRWREGRADLEWLSAFPAALLALVDTPVEAVNSHEGSLTPDDDDVLGAAIQDDEESQPNIDTVRSALDSISADCDRDTWRDVLFILHSTRWKCAKALAREWSETAPKLFKEKNFNDTWRSAKERSNGVKLGSLFRMARLKGWVDPRKKGTGDHIETYGDLSNGMRLARKYQGKLLYCTDINTWYGWDDIRWVVNKQELAAAKAVAIEIVMETLKQDREVSSDGSRKNLSQAMIVHKNGKRLDEMLKLARSEPGMSVPNPGAFNVDPWHMGVPNGVIDLRDGTLLDADPAQRITKQAGAAFDPDAKCPKWLAFMDAVFEGDAELIGFMQRLTGYCLTGSVQEEKLFFLYGHGANGKSVFCTVLEAVLGEYSVTVGPVMLMKGGGTEADKHVYRLVGARLASANELGIHDIWDDLRVKSLTSRDKIPARAMYGNLFEFTPTHTLLIRGNHMPGIHDAGEGMRRRLVLVPFNRQFSESEREADLDRQLINEELSGILAWGVQGCVDWQSNGLRIPKKIAKLTAQYQDDADLLGGWLEGCCRREVGAETDLTVLYTSFKLHCENEGVRAPSKMVFGRQLADKGFQARKTNSRRMYNGICLLDEGGDL